MSTSTDTLILSARADRPLAVGVNPSWQTDPGKFFRAIPEPLINDCPARTEVVTGDAVTFNGAINGNNGMMQWVSPPLDGDQTFHTTDTVIMKLTANDVSGLDAGHDTGTRAHLRIVDSAGNDRGSSLVTFATGSGTSPIPKSGLSVVTFYNDILENTVNALDGDRIVVELGYVWATHGVPGDTDNHGPDEFKADDDGKVIFSFPVAYQDESAACLGGGISAGPLLGGAGPGAVAAPSCDNTMLGG